MWACKMSGVSARPRATMTARQGKPRLKSGTTRPPRAATQALLVTGMHRSGTSAVGHLLTAAGIHAGPPELQMADDLANPFGYAELQPIAEFNDEVLAEMGWVWDAPPATPSPQSSVRAELVGRGRAFAQRNMQSSPWFLKDARFSLLMPLWRRILLDRLVAVVSVRPALEVAWSLSVRDGIPITLGIALWAAYYRHLAAGLSGLQVIAVDYVHLVEEPIGTAASLLLSLRELGITTTGEPEDAASVIHANLRRTSVPSRLERVEAVPIADLLPGLNPAPVSLFSKFEITARPPEQWEIDALDEHRLRRLEQYASVRQSSEIDRLSRDVAAVERERDGLKSERNALTAERDGLAAEMRHVGANEKALTAERDRLIHERETLSRNFQQALDDQNELANRHARAEAERDELRVSLNRLTSELVQLRTELGELAAERDTLLGLRLSLTSELEHVATELSAARSDNSELRANIDERTRDLVRLRNELATIDDERVQVRDALAGFRLRAAELSATADALSADLKKIGEAHRWQVERLERQLDQQQRENDDLGGASAALKQLVTTYETSTSWRWTAPARAVGRFVRRLWRAG